METLFATYGAAVWQVLLELAPSLFLGAAIAGLLHGFLPVHFAANHLRGFWGVVKAAALGVPMPLCSCGVLPAAFGLKKDGASDGATVGFLISTPQTGVDSIAVSAAFLGWPFAIFKMLSALVTGLLGGWATHLWGGPGRPAEQIGGHGSKDRSLRGMFDHAVSLLRAIWGWLVIGVLVSAAITVWLPPGLLNHYGSGLPAMLVALAIGLPLYVCATASVPIAAALVAAGLSPGAALVFLMAGPASNAASIGSIYRALGGRILAIYLLTIGLCSLAGGLLFDAVLGESMHVSAHAAHLHGHGAAWWQVALAIVLVLVLAAFATDDLRRWWQTRRGTFASAASAAASATAVAAVGAVASTVDHLSVDVEGLSCQNCVRTLEQTLGREQGVREVRVSLHPGRAEVVGSISETRLRELVDEAGYRAI